MLPNTDVAKQSVDDSDAALEITFRSSYVPAFSHRRLTAASRPVVRAQRGARPARLEMPIWMKC
jgi:hypothetical protein